MAMPGEIFGVVEQAVGEVVGRSVLAQAGDGRGEGGALVAALAALLAALLAGHGLDVETTDANWVLVHGAGDLRDRLARSGVLVRDCASFGMAGTVRVAVPAEVGLQRLAEALSAS